MLDSLVIQIIHGCPVGHVLEEAAEIFGGHSGRDGQLFQSTTVLIVGVYVLENIFSLVTSFMITDGLRRLFVI